MAKRDPEASDIIRPAWQAFQRAVAGKLRECSVDELMRSHVAARCWMNQLERVLDGKGSAPPKWPTEHKKTRNGLVLIAEGEVVPEKAVAVLPGSRRDTPMAALSMVLDAERARAVVEHRQRLRKPLTGHAARLLAGKLRKAPDPNAAADLMIERGWQGFEVAWLDSHPVARGAPERRPSLGEHALGELMKMRRGEIDDE